MALKAFIFLVENIFELYSLSALGRVSEKELHSRSAGGGNVPLMSPLAPIENLEI